MKEITTEDVEDIAVGAAVLGTGGGGDPHIGKLVAKQAIEQYGPVRVLTPEELEEDALVIPTAQMGAPTVSHEQPPGGGELVNSFKRLERELGKSAFATMPMECGGINSTFPIAVAAQLDIPIVDADGMGRAFPELQHETFNIYGVSGTPATVSDSHGNISLLETVDNDDLEWIARGITVRMGGVAYLAHYPMSGTEVKETSIPETLSFARDLGRAIQTSNDDVIEAIKSVTADSIYGEAITLFDGKIVDVKHRTERGFVFGHVRFEGLDEDEGEELEIEFQNENLAAKIDGRFIATVPDLITVLDRDTGVPVPTERLRYGARVRILAIPTPEIMRTDAALEVWGPKTFGIDAEYTPIES